MIPFDDIQTPQGMSRAWLTFLTKVGFTTEAQRESGVTANRPTKGLWTGRRYWDTTLQKPVYYTGSAWKDAAGNVV